MSNLQLNLVQENFILELGTVGPPGPAGGGDDTLARAAIGWPYTNPESLSTRVTTDEIAIANIDENISDLTVRVADTEFAITTLEDDTDTIDLTLGEVETAIGWPYGETSSLNQRVTVLENGAGVDSAARAAIGWPYTDPLDISERLTADEGNIETLRTEVTDINGDIVTINSSIQTLNNKTTALDTAVGIPYTNPASLSSRVSTLEAETDLSVVGTTNQISVSTVNSVATVGLAQNIIIPTGSTLTVNGTATFNGTTNYNDVVDLNVTDNVITLNYGTLTPENAYIQVDRGTGNFKAALIWNDSPVFRWQIGDPSAASSSWVNLLIPSDLDVINTAIGTWPTSSRSISTVIGGWDAQGYSSTNITASITSILASIASINSTLSSIPAKFSQTIGNGVDTSFTITHNKSTYDVLCNVYDTVTNQTVYPDIIRPSANTVRIVFGFIPPTDRYRVVIY